VSSVLYRDNQINEIGGFSGDFTHPYTRIHVTGVFPLNARIKKKCFASPFLRNQVVTQETTSDFLKCVIRYIMGHYQTFTRYLPVLPAHCTLFFRKVLRENIQKKDPGIISKCGGIKPSRQSGYIYRTEARVKPSIPVPGFSGKLENHIPVL
jgi:hypothetical protein